MTSKAEILSDLSPEHLQLVPGGDSRCRICTLPVDELEHFHNLKKKKEYKYPKLATWLKKHYGMKIRAEAVAVHFRLHAHIGKEELMGKSDYPEVIQALIPLEKSVVVETDKHIEQAYQTLVKIAQRFTSDFNKIYSEVGKIIEAKNIEEELEGLSALELLERMGKIAREARDQVREVSALRAPKVMVAQMLEKYMNELIKETGGLLVTLCGEIHHAVHEQLQAHDVAHLVPLESFADVFKRAGVEFKERTLAIKRQQLADALAALSDMEKII